jgi:hypothetical protein
MLPGIEPFKVRAIGGFIKYQTVKLQKKVNW